MKNILPSNKYVEHNTSSITSGNLQNFIPQNLIKISFFHHSDFSQSLKSVSQIVSIEFSVSKGCTLEHLD